MEKLIKVSELNKLVKQVTKGDITFSRVVEIINLKHLKELSNLRHELTPKERMFTETEISQLQSKVHQITGNGEVMVLFNSMLGVSGGNGN